MTFQEALEVIYAPEDYFESDTVQEAIHAVEF